MITRNTLMLISIYITIFDVEKQDFKHKNNLHYDENYTEANYKSSHTKYLHLNSSTKKPDQTALAA